MLHSDDVSYRLVQEGDINFVKNSYLKSYRDYVKLGHDDYYAKHEEKIDEIMNIGTCLIACHPTNQNDIFGWCLVSKSGPNDQTVAHYVYVKRIYRNFGIGTALLEHFGINWRDDIVLTDHLTNAARMLNRKYNDKIIDIETAEASTDASATNKEPDNLK